MVFKTLITADQLSTLDAEYCLIDCRFSLADPEHGFKQYLTGHLPGAYYADLEKDLSSAITADTGRHPLPDFNQLTKKINSWGITDATQVVVYDDINGSFAARLWWLLRTLNHQNVAVLDGGIQAWQASGQTLRQGVPLPVSSAKASFTGTVDKSSWCDIGELQASLKTNDCLLIDSRAQERFSGQQEPIDPVAGHIPGAVNLPNTDNIDQAGFFLNSDLLRKNYQRLIGNMPIQKVIHQCGSGVFACQAILAMEHAGLKGSKLYAGSWSEWIRDPKRNVCKDFT